ncbi:alpha-1,3/1,6-mannosyltransferase ALG2 [Neocloeon triangulifer]|uniref:alpha-1,3/1,6-mannosyltransferase ALG2 n=1 Tax=Neocloeon triangulifer TaxID=2078957 RepID=UPI00286F5A5C|nr:alpha-1,3/1,6-mannosyltransferase ALG2 [Neocloeon triangulifer]
MVKVIFLHPDLGIGGAERLVVDAGLALKLKGHQVHFVTSHHDPSHCFSETRDGTLDVTVAGDWLPRSVFGFLFALCAYLRMIFAALYLVFFSNLEPDVVFCDQVSVCVPVLKTFSKAKVLFYCHFPDQLLSKPGGHLKQMYRAPLNWLEETTTGQADVVLVNSKFTSDVFARTFPRLAGITPKVLYPSLNTKFFDTEVALILEEVTGVTLPDDAVVFLSINRYERKKNLGLAILALAHLRKVLDEDTFAKVHLVMAGGYDVRVEENLQHFEELQQLVEENDLQEKVTMLRSPSDEAKLVLLRSCKALIYTPENEHFGIVPLEAMYLGRPVVAVNSGGPTETVLDGQTGFLCPPEAQSFASAMAKIARGKADNLSRNCRERVKKHFSFEAFADQLDACISGLNEN